MSGESVRLAVAFSQLTAGVMVEFRGKCVGCGKDRCRAMVIGPGRFRCECGKEAVEITSCDETPSCLCPDNITAGQVYIVDTGLESSTTTEAVRPMETVR